MRNFAVALTVGVLAATSAAATASALQVPEFTHNDAASWINTTTPLSLTALRGRVVLLEFWTFDCVNCLRSLPWLKSLAERHLQEGLVVVGVHTPELAEERVDANVRAAVRRLGVAFPVMLDRDYSYWSALHNQYWPAYYLVGKDGTLADVIVGEMHEGEPRAVALERRVRSLLSTP